MMRPMFRRTDQAIPSENTNEIYLESTSFESKYTLPGDIPLSESLMQGETIYLATESSELHFPKFHSEREDGCGTTRYGTSSSCKPWYDFYANQNITTVNQARLGVDDIVDLTSSEKIIPVIVSSMRGGHRCIAADSSKCAYMKYLSGNDIRIQSRIQTSSQVPKVKIKSVKREKIENKDDASQYTCNGCHKTFANSSNKRMHIRLGRCKIQKDKKRTRCDACKTEFKLPKYLRNHVLLQRCRGKAAK